MCIYIYIYRCVYIYIYICICICICIYIYIHNRPYLWSGLDASWFGDAAPPRSRGEVLRGYLDYAEEFLAAELIDIDIHCSNADNSSW